MLEARKFTYGQLYALSNIVTRGTCGPVSLPTWNWLKENGVIDAEGNANPSQANRILFADISLPEKNAKS